MPEPQPVPQPHNADGAGHSAAPAAAPDADLQAGDGKPKEKPNLWGIPLRGWAVGAISFLAVVGAAGHYGMSIYDDYQKIKLEKKDAEDKKADLQKKLDAVQVSHNSTSQYSTRIVDEMKRHEHDTNFVKTTLSKDKSGKATVATYFLSDGCIAISRPSPPLPYMNGVGEKLEWSLGPSTRPELIPPPTADELQNVRHKLHRRAPAIQPRVQRATWDPIDKPQLKFVSDQPEFREVQAGCFPPGAVHPGPFQSWYGAANGCWVPLYRKFPDGCTHYQMYNTCVGQWDPNIHWTFCNPNHNH